MRLPVHASSGVESNVDSVFPKHRGCPHGLCFSLLNDVPAKVGIVHRYESFPMG